MGTCFISVILKFVNQQNRTKLISPQKPFSNFFHTNSSTSSKESGPNPKNVAKKKVTVIRRSFSANQDEPPKILEWKDASIAMKKFNWENKLLYGPVQSSKKDSFSEAKIHESNQIIQHQTQFPIVEPRVNLKSTSSQGPIYSEYQQNKINQKLDCNGILDFPLLNKANNEFNIESHINDLNVLRKYLENISCSYTPSISVILEKTMPKESVEALTRWKQNMIEKLGLEGFETYRSDLLKNGASLHANINCYLSTTPEQDLYIEEVNRGHWKSLKSVFPQISNIKLLEERVSHPFLCYKGIVDCFAMYRDHLVVIDWKTSKKSKLTLSSTFDNPLQIAAYVGALNFDPKFQYLVNKGLIVVAYENGKPATVHFLDETKMLQYWREWLKRIKLYWELTETSKDS